MDTNPRRRILVPLDGSPLSEAAVEAAMPLAKAMGAGLSLLRVTPAGQEIGGVDKVYMTLMGDGLAEKGLDVSVHFRLGEPAEEILGFTEVADIDLIAMSSHGRTGLTRLLMGSVAEKVVRRADVPVLVWHPGAKAAATIRRIAVALDGSEISEEMLPEAVMLARALGATLDVVRVGIPIVTAGGMGEIPLIFANEDPMPYLKTVVERLAKEGVEATPVAMEGRAASELLRHATERGVDLICMTSHGRTGLSRVLLGSIAEEVLRNAPCPILIRRMGATGKLLRPQPLRV